MLADPVVTAERAVDLALDGLRAFDLDELRRDEVAADAHLGFLGRSRT
jgi:hypothetical protein